MGSTPHIITGAMQRRISAGIHIPFWKSHKAHKKPSEVGNDVLRTSVTVGEGEELFSVTPDWVLESDVPPEDWGCCRRACASVLQSEFPNSNTSIFDTFI